MENNLQNFADLGKELMQKDGHWESALTDLKKRKKPSEYKWVIMGLLLLGAIGIGFLVLGNQKKNEPLHIAYFETLPTSLVPNVRARDNIEKTNLQKAVIAYGDKKFEEAERLLNQVTNEEDDNFAKLYLASIYISQNKGEEATGLLNEIQEPDLTDYVSWYKALSLLSNSPDKAKILLSEIANNDKHFKSKKAQEVLQKEFEQR